VTLFGVRAAVRTARPEFLDSFLIAAVATVLLIRVLLAATDYPRLGGGELHIAHVLWGGLGMLVAMVLLLGFVSASTRHLAAVIGGAGFGAFVDELGKFITTDNNYFFRPTAALVYVLFVGLFLVVRQLSRPQQLTPRESLVNAVEYAEELAAGDLDEYERTRALELLAQADQRDPLVAFLRQRFIDAEARGASSPSAVQRLRDRASAFYRRVAATTAFRRVVIAVFGIQGLFFLLSFIAVTALFAGTALADGNLGDAFALASGGRSLTLAIQLVANFLAGVLLVRGLLAVRHSRLTAYRSFELAILVDLLLNQPFAFFDQGFGQSIDVLIDLGLLAMLRVLKAEEHRLLAFTRGR
jgi:hypothetical protein